MTAHLPAPAAVLWDLDGTLIDTEPLWKVGEYALVAEHGGQWSESHANAIVGSDLLEAAEYIRRQGGVDLAPVDIVERLVTFVADGIGDDTPWRPGAVALLDQLVATAIPCALVTMSWRPIVDRVAALLPGAPFAAFVAGDEVDNGKPHAEPYLRAATALGVDPRACVAIEDSPTGIASARAAGCAVLAVPNMVEVTDAEGVTVMRSLADVDLGVLADVLHSHRARSVPAGALRE